MSKERTLSIIKPDAVEKKLTGKIIAHLQGAGFDVLAMRQTHLSKTQAEGFYAVHKARPFFGELVEFMTRSPVVIMVLEADNAIQKYRDVIGATDPAQAADGTIRKLYGASKGENAMHGSDAPETAAFEIGYFFPGHEVAAKPALRHNIPMRAARQPEEEAAGGVLRDSVSALQNLHSLLRSPRVGPKAIAPLLAEILESCRPVGGAVHALAGALSGLVDDRAPLDALATYATAQIDGILAAVSRAQRTDLDARARLALEGEVVRLAPSIEATRALFDLVAAAADEAAVDVDLADLLEEALAPASQRAVSWPLAVTVAAYLPLRGGPTVSVQPRVAMPLLHLGIAHVLLVGSKLERTTSHLFVPSADVTAVEISATAPSGGTPRLDSVLVKPPIWIPPSGPVAELAARTAGISFRLDQGPHARVEFAKSAQ